MKKKCARSHFSIPIIFICLQLVLEASISLRGVPKSLGVLFSAFPFLGDIAIPSYKTIQRWIARFGLFKLIAPKKKSSDTILFVDSSKQSGANKCYTVLRTHLKDFKNKSPTCADMEALAIEVIKDKAEPEVYFKIFDELIENTGKPAAIYADDGTEHSRTLNQYCEKFAIPRLYDPAHKLATFYKHAFRKDPAWIEFTKAAADSKKKMQQTDAAFLAPNKQRSMARFMNMEILIHWGLNILAAMSKPNNPDKELLEKHCGWVREYEGFLNNWSLN